MTRKIVIPTSLIFVLLLNFNFAKSQVFWQEDFGTGCNQGTTANGHLTANGLWTVTQTGANDPFANEWFISAVSSPSSGLPRCDLNCTQNANDTLKTLHISNPAVPPGTIPTVTQPIGADTGAMFFTSGACNAPISNLCIVTDKRVESPTINCLGRTGIMISFEYLEGGTAPADNATLYMFDGTTWTFVADMPKTTACVGGEGEWDSFLTTLPASADNNPNVKIGFLWVNNDDMAMPALAHSFSVRNITLSTSTGPIPLVAAYTLNTPMPVCEGSLVSFSSNSTGYDTLQWLFPGGTPATSNVANPTITYNTAGTYDVFLTVYDTTTGTTADTVALGSIIIDPCAGPPTANFTASQTTICKGDCINFNDLSTGSPNSWSWFFPGATVISSNLQNPTSICYDSAGVFTVGLTAANLSGSNDIIRTNYITVLGCDKPIPHFGVNRDSICVGQCVRFTDSSLYANSREWTFFGADSIYQISNAISPTVCYTNPGLYDVRLLVANIYGDSTEVFLGVISVKDYPLVTTGEDLSMLAGDKIVLNVSGDSGSYVWTPRETLSCFRCKNPVAEPSETTMYYASIINDHGCASIDSVEVKVIDEYFAGVPTAFSPNFDSQNDVLYVRGNGIYSLDFYIYNRMGQRVFETTDQSIGWNGKYKNVEVPQGVYPYYLKVRFINGREDIKKGNITLVR